MVYLQKEFILRRAHDLRTVASGHEVHYMIYNISGPDDLNQYLGVPCRAKLHHALTGLFYKWDWEDESDKIVSKEVAYALKHVFQSQEEYKLWKQTIAKINELGTEEAKKWFVDQVKVLTLRKVIREK